MVYSKLDTKKPLFNSLVSITSNREICDNMAYDGPRYYHNKKSLFYSVALVTHACMHTHAHTQACTHTHNVRKSYCSIV